MIKQSAKAAIITSILWRSLANAGVARTASLDSVWTVDSLPIVPSEEQIENSSIYYMAAGR